MKRYKNASDIKVGVVGYGGAFNMGRAHLNEMKRAGMTPVAVAEPDVERLKVAEEEFPGIQTYRSLTEMLKKSDVNLITIITPHNTHAKLALEALKAGRHVCCEKPLAITTAECDAMIAAAKKSGVVLSTYHNRHWDGHILKAVEIIKDQKAIGDVVRVEVAMGGWGKPGDWWRSSKSISGGIMYDWGVHLLEYTLQLVDAEVSEVSGYSWSGIWADQTKWKKDTNEDDACCVVRYKSGAWSTLASSSIEGRPGTWFKVTGTKGTYVMDWGTYELITHDGAQTVTTKGPNVQGEGWKFYQNIADHLTKGEKLIITPEWSRRPIHILDLACRSAAKGQALKAKYT